MRKGRYDTVAYINYKKLGAEVDALAIKYKNLKNKGNLTHKEEKECFDCFLGINELLLDYAIVETKKRGIYHESSGDTNNEILWKVIEYTLKYFLNNNEKGYFKLFCSQYKLKMNDIVDGYLKENRLGDYNERYVNVSVNDDENTDNEIFDKQSLSDYSNEQRRNNNLYDIIELLMKETRELALKKGNKYVDRTRGFWTIRFIIFEISKQRAEDWEIYIILWFFNKYLHLGYDNKKLMLLMCEALGDIKVDTLRKEFDRIIRFIKDNHPYILKRLC